MEPTVLRVDPGKPEAESIEAAAGIILGGGLVVYPTDTSYGLGASALDRGAVERVYRVKRRPPTKPIHVVVSDLGMVERYAHVGVGARRLAGRFWPGPLTLVLRKREGLSDALSPGGTVGFRVPDHPVALALVRRAGVPITATSANLTGRPDPYTVEEVLGYFGGAVDLYLDAGRLPRRSPSTVVDLTRHPPRVLREGPVPRDEVERLSGLSR